MAERGEQGETEALLTPDEEPLGTPAPESAVAMTVVVRGAVRAVTPVLLIAGLHLVAWGYSPGGGFPGGAVLLGGILLVYVGYGYRKVRRVIGTGLYAVLTKRNLVKIVMGLSLVEASTYVLLLSIAYRAHSTAPVLLNPTGGQSAEQLAKGNVADPVLQNIGLIAIGIGIAVTGVFLAVTARIAQHYRTIDADQIRSMRG